MAARSQPDDQTSYTEVVQALQGYNCAQALTAIGQVSRALEVKDPKVLLSRFRDLVPGTVNQWQLAFLAKTLLMTTNDFGDRQIGDEEIIGACGLYNEMRDPRIGNDDVELDDLDLTRFMIRTSNEQFPFQMGYFAYEIARASFLYEDMAARAPRNLFDFGKEFGELTGLTPKEFISLGIVFWSRAGRPMPLRLTSEQASLRAILGPEKQDRFLTLVSADYEGFRAAQSKVETNPGYGKFEFNALRRYPLIRSPQFNLLICPTPPLLLSRFTRGIFYLMLDAFNRGGKDNSFAAHFGKEIFEPYVGLQLREHLPSNAVVGEQQISKSDKTCDWIVDCDGIVVLVECKTTALTAKAKAFADMQQVGNDLKLRIASGVRACERTKAAIAAGKNGLSRFAGKPTVNLIIFYDEAYLFNGDPFREIIADELSRLGVGAADYQICTILELEEALPALRSFGFGRFWQEKVQSAARRSQGLSRTIEKMVAAGEIQEPERNALLQTRCGELFDSLLPAGRSVTDS